MITFSPVQHLFLFCTGVHSVGPVFYANFSCPRHQVVIQCTSHTGIIARIIPRYCTLGDASPLGSTGSLLPTGQVPWVPVCGGPACREPRDEEVLTPLSREGVPPPTRLTRWWQLKLGIR